MTRASLINLAVYSEDPDSLGRNTQLISQLTEDHACRAIVIAANPSAKHDKAEAWISAHCHISRAGSKQICSEQLSFSLQGPCTSLLPNIVFSQLDSDLPFYLWWQAPLRQSVDSQLWAWVDRLIFDSQAWPDFARQFQLIEAAQRESHQRIVLCDLNWTRLDKLRGAIAQFFDHPYAQRHLQELSSATIVHAPEFRTTALLLAGWLGAQLGWTAPARNGAADRLAFENSNRDSIEVVLKEKPGLPITEVLLQTREIDYRVCHAKCGDLLEVSRAPRGQKGSVQMLPAQSNDPVELLGQELLRGGPHRVYLRAVNCIRARL
jgi:glucose-6-phosphate dehydrogenase assembly protein OpcA